MSIIASYIVEQDVQKNQIKLNSIATLSEMIILFIMQHGGCYSLLYHFPIRSASAIIVTQQKGKRYQEIKATETFEFKNTTSNFKYCNYCKKLRTISDYRDNRDSRRIFR